MSGPRHDPALYRERDRVPVRRALISVSDKTGVLELAAALAAAGIELVSTGSTAARIREAGHPVTEVANVTGSPEMLDGRVKTLHPAIHGGLLADLRLASHERELAEHGIAPFELVVVNLYPFRETVASGAAPDDIVEQIDIGGPAMVRASAKNFANVAVVVSPARYDEVVRAVATGGTTLEQRRELASAAFSHTASYDAAVAAWFASGPGAPSSSGVWPERQSVVGQLKQVLRYGENSHQGAALYTDAAASSVQNGRGLAQAEQLGGKEMSYNNFVDADAAVRCAFDFTEPAVAIIKHANPCGIAIGADVAEAHARAHACDPVSAYGGVVATNRSVSVDMARTVKDIFTEVIVAPDFDPEALELLRSKKNLRILRLPAGYARPEAEVRQISGGLLVQTSDRFGGEAVRGQAEGAWSLVAGEPAGESLLDDLGFAWRACRSVKSNGILLASGGASVGVGMGQVNRVDSCRLAVSRAGERAAGSVAASDAFFPFADGPQILIDAGVRAIVQPGGSIRDEETVAAAQKASVTMYFTGRRHFLH